MKCLICGKFATGVHYGVLSCEGCKAFYRRGVEKKLLYFCLDDDSCIVKAGAKGCCKACRFRKCRELGMNIFGASNNDIPVKPITEKDTVKREKKRYKEGKGTDTCIPQAGWISSAGTSSMRLGKAIVWYPLRQESAFQTYDNMVLDQPQDSLSIISEEVNIRSSSRETTSKDVHLVPNIVVHREDRQVVSLNRELPMSSRKWSVYSTVHDLYTVLPTSPFISPQRVSMILTAELVARAVEMVFGDQIKQWTAFMDRATIHGEVSHQPQVTQERVLKAVKDHNEDVIGRVQEFAGLLPGIGELDVAATHSITVGWKWMVFWMIHHAAFFTRIESYITIGSEEIHYGRYWQDMLHEWPLVVFIYQFCGKFQDIGLSQVEKYTLLAIVLFEPGTDPDISEPVPENVFKLDYLHRHYTNVLFDMIKDRCGDDRQLVSVCRRLEQFFNNLKRVYGVHGAYRRALNAKQVENPEIYSCVWWKANHEFGTS